MLKLWLLAISLVICTNIQAATDTPYQGQQHRDIKSLSPSDIDGYLSGKGMGFAKAAELNHYPGPRHVLDLAKELKLSKSQQEQTQTLFDKMQAEAITIGNELVRQEKELDQLFAQKKVDKKSLNSLLQKIGSTRAKLRFIHLSTHLEQKQILNKHQVMLYDQLRGYAGGNDEHHHMHPNH